MIIITMAATRAIAEKNGKISFRFRREDRWRELCSVAINDKLTREMTLKKKGIVNINYVPEIWGAFPRCAFEEGKGQYPKDLWGDRGGG